jgi:hypothetical protein
VITPDIVVLVSIYIAIVMPTLLVWAWLDGIPTTYPQWFWMGAAHIVCGVTVGICINTIIERI